MTENTVENWVSIRAFGRMHGITHGAVQKAVLSGRIDAVRRGDNGRIEAIEAVRATQQWKANTDRDQAARAGSAILEELDTRPVPGVQPAQQMALDSAGIDRAESVDRSAAPAAGGDSYLEARTRTEQFRAKQAELDYLAALGKVISTEDLQRVSARRYAMVRDKLLNIPDRLATLLANERDPARVHAQLTGELKRILNELADAAESETAGGTAERVAA